MPCHIYDSSTESFLFDGVAARHTKLVAQQRHYAGVAVPNPRRNLVDLLVGANRDTALGPIRRGVHRARPGEAPARTVNSNGKSGVAVLPLGGGGIPDGDEHRESRRAARLSELVLADRGLLVSLFSFSNTAAAYRYPEFSDCEACLAEIEHVVVGLHHHDYASPLTRRRA